MSEAQAARRRAYVAARPGYRPALHLGFVVVYGVAAAALCLALLDAPSALEWSAAPIWAVVANAAEWRFHRDLLHRRVPPLHWVYDAHNGHHACFVDDMAVAGAGEWLLVLLPWWAIAALSLALAPLLALAALALGANVALLVMATSMLYVVAYEVMHLIFHLPRAHPLTRTRWHRRLARHHTLHHDPTLMRTHNFNVVVPLWDRLRGTSTRAGAGG